MEAPRKKMGWQKMDLEGINNAENEGWALGISCAKGYIFWLVTRWFTVLAMGLNRNLILLKEGSTVDNCMNSWFMIGFQNNKITETRFCALLYQYSFTNYMKCVQKQKYSNIQTELKGNLLCLQAQPATFGHVICRMTSGFIKTIQWDTFQQSLYTLWKQVPESKTVGGDPWKRHCPCPWIAELVINFSDTQHLIYALISAVWQCHGHSNDQPVTSSYRGHDMVSFSACF